MRSPRFRSFAPTTQDGDERKGISSKGWKGSIFFVLFLTIGILGRMVTAGETRWEWTKGQGWSEGGGTPKETPAAQLRYAYELEQKNEFNNAAKQYFLLIKTYPTTSEAGVALQRLAKCLFEMENYYASYRALEQVLESYPSSATNIADLVAIQYRIGQKLQKGARKSLLEKENPRESKRAAIEVFESVLKHDPFGPYADNALLALGDCYRELNEIEKAKTYYQRLIREFPKSELLDHARLGIAECDARQGDARPGEVQQIISEIKTRESEKKKESGSAKPSEEEEEEPLTQRLNELEEAQAKSLYESARVYEKRATKRSRKAAIWTYNEVIRRYPNTTYADLARKRIGKVTVPDDPWLKLPEIKLIPPFLKKETPPFVTPQKGEDAVQAWEVVPPLPGEPNLEGESAARPLPAAPPPPVQSTAPPTSTYRSPPKSLSPPSPRSGIPKIPSPEESSARSSPKGKGESLSPLQDIPSVPSSISRSTSEDFRISRTTPESPSGAGAMPAAMQRRRTSEASRSEDFARSRPPSRPGEESTSVPRILPLEEERRTPPPRSTPSTSPSPSTPSKWTFSEDLQ